LDAFLCLGGNALPDPGDLVLKLLVPNLPEERCDAADVLQSGIGSRDENPLE
jgi:hypothetical protein